MIRLTLASFIFLICTFFMFNVQAEFTQTEINTIEKDALDGDAGAQTDLGYLYTNGLGVKQDYKQAKFWYEKAAEQNYALAQYNLGFLYHGGLGVKRNYQQAKIWFEKAAKQG